MSSIISNTAALLKNDQNLVWLDCEMTGLDPEKERLIEIAVVVTGPHLEPRVEGPVFVIHQSDELLDQMDSWQEALITFLSQYVSAGASPMCGNTIGQDRRFLAKYMPQLEAFFHYRNLDVSTLKELSKRWRPEVYSSFKKQQKHTALADVHESIEELCHYREHFLNLK